MATQREERPKLQMCTRCGYVACMCPILRHDKACQRRQALTNPHPIPCEKHQRYGCYECWPCDCGKEPAPCAVTSGG